MLLSKNLVTVGSTFVHEISLCFATSFSIPWTYSSSPERAHGIVNRCRLFSS